MASQSIVNMVGVDSAEDLGAEGEWWGGGKAGTWCWANLQKSREMGAAAAGKMVSEDRGEN